MNGNLQKRLKWKSGPIASHPVYFERVRLFVRVVGSNEPPESYYLKNFVLCDRGQDSVIKDVKTR